MNIESVKSLFRLYSGEEDIGEYMPLITLAAEEVKCMLRPDADDDDVRLGFLCAALANYRLQQANAAHDRSESTYAGKMKYSSESGTVLKYARNLLSEYMQLCGDLITDGSFVFASFGADGEVSANA